MKKRRGSTSASAPKRTRDRNCRTALRRLQFLSSGLGGDHYRSVSSDAPYGQSYSAGGGVLPVPASIIAFEVSDREAFTLLFKTFTSGSCGANENCMAFCL